MTYGELLQKLYELNPEQLQADVTIHNQDDEWFAVPGFYINEGETDVLDEGHPYLEIP